MANLLSKRIKDWATSITSFRTGDVIPVDGPSGTAKMSKDDLLKVTAQNALVNNVAPAFVPNETNAVAGMLYIYGGQLYVAKEDYSGAWDASKFTRTSAKSYFASNDSVLNKFALVNEPVGDRRNQVKDFNWGNEGEALFKISNSNIGTEYSSVVTGGSPRWKKSGLIDITGVTKLTYRLRCFKLVYPIVFFDFNKIVIGFARSSADGDTEEVGDVAVPNGAKFALVQSCRFPNENESAFNRVFLKFGASVYSQLNAGLKQPYVSAVKDYIEIDGDSLSSESVLDDYLTAASKGARLATYGSSVIGTDSYYDGTAYDAHWFKTALIPKQEFFAQLGMFYIHIVYPICFYDENLTLVGVDDTFYGGNSLVQFHYTEDDFPEGAVYFALQFTDSYGDNKLHLKTGVLSEKQKNEMAISSNEFDSDISFGRYGWLGYLSGVFLRTSAIGSSYFAVCSDYIGSRWVRSNLVKIPSWVDKIKVHTYEFRTVAPVVFFDDNYEVLVLPSPRNTNGIETQVFTVPDGAKYFCVQTDKVGDNTPDWDFMQVTYALPKKNSLSDYVRKFFAVQSWKDKRVAWLGDSITDPNHIGTTKNYWQYLEELVGLKSYSYGINGAQSNTISHQVDNALAASVSDGEKVDAVFIFIGTNDYNADVPIGEWYTETTESVSRHGETVTLKKKVMNTSPSTFKGRLYNGILYAKQKFPDSQIVLMTPLHRGQYGSGSSLAPSELYANGIDVYLDSYVQAVKEAANVLSVRVIDLNAESGLYPLLNEFAKYFASSSDTLHPNALGHLRIALTIASDMNMVNSRILI